MSDQKGGGEFFVHYAELDDGFTVPPDEDRSRRTRRAVTSTTKMQVSTKRAMSVPLTGRSVLRMWND